MEKNEKSRINRKNRKNRKNHIHQVHDKLFKLTFSDEGVKESFLSTYLPPELVADIDLNTVEEVADHFISENFQLKESDLLMKAKLLNGKQQELYILALMEHKSYKDKTTPFQILRYLIDIWQSQLEKKEKLTPIIPIVIYEGRKKWKYPQLEYYFKYIDPKWRRFLPLYESLFFDFSLENQPKQLPENILLRSYLLLISIVYIKDQKKFIEKTIEIMEFVYKKNGNENIEVFGKIFQRILTYAENIRPDIKKDETTLLDIMKGENQMYATSVEKWINEIEEKGVKKGREEGREEERFSLARNMKNMGYSLEDIIKLTGISKNKLKML